MTIKDNRGIGQGPSYRFDQYHRALTAIRLEKCGGERSVPEIYASDEGEELAGACHAVAAHIDDVTLAFVDYLCGVAADVREHGVKSDASGLREGLWDVVNDYLTSSLRGKADLCAGKYKDQNQEHRLSKSQLGIVAALTAVSLAIPLLVGMLVAVGMAA